MHRISVRIYEKGDLYFRLNYKVYLNNMFHSTFSSNPVYININYVKIILEGIKIPEEIDQ